MNKTKIDWPELDYTWNPVIGCKRNCSYCYAKRMNTRFKWIPEWTDPQFFPERLKIPFKVKKPSTWFIGSISDICYWKDRWMMEVLDVCEKTPHHRYMFLTKDPIIYEEYLDIFERINCMIGVTITSPKDLGYHFSIECFYNIPHKQKFISIEPILGAFTYMKFCNIKLIIVGADTSPKPIIPKKEWINSIKHPNIHFKNNIPTSLLPKAASGLG
jgi:protein gp37